MLVGDIVDDKSPMSGAVLFLSLIKDIAPIYYVTGNHEYYTYNVPGILEMLQSFGVHILSDNFAELKIKGNNIIIAGIDDLSSMSAKGIEKYYGKTYTKNNIENMLTAAGDAYTILLIHRPESALPYKNNFDLMLSGHAHGGQIRSKLFKNGLYAPGQGFFPEYTGGLYILNSGESIKSAKFIVSAGLSTKRPNFPRIKNPPEVVFITIRRE
jgi:predicted MPP superfamily phosphohydrolase